MVWEYDVSFFSDANMDFYYNKDSNDNDNERTNELMMLTIVRYCYNVYSCCNMTLLDFKSSFSIKEFNARWMITDTLMCCFLFDTFKMNNYDTFTCRRTLSIHPIDAWGKSSSNEPVHSSIKLCSKCTWLNWDRIASDLMDDGCTQFICSFSSPFLLFRSIIEWICL